MGIKARFIASVVASLLAVGSGHAAPTDAELIEKAKAEIGDALRDPDSAQFRSIRVVQQEPPVSTAVCGEVNANNGFGGKSGYSAFFVVFLPDGTPFKELQEILPGVRLNSPPPNSAESIILAVNCGQPKPE